MRTLPVGPKNLLDLRIRRFAEEIGQAIRAEHQPITRTKPDEALIWTKQLLLAKRTGKGMPIHVILIRSSVLSHVILRKCHLSIRMVTGEPPELAVAQKIRARIPRMNDDPLILHDLEGDKGRP